MELEQIAMHSGRTGWLVSGARIREMGITEEEEFTGNGALAQEARSGMERLGEGISVPSPQRSVDKEERTFHGRLISRGCEIVTR